MRVVIDTNVLVSSSMSTKGSPAHIFQYWREGAFELVVSEAILAEYRRALGYPRVRERHGYNPHEIDQLVADIRQSAILVAPGSALNVVSEDPDDNKFLECAVEGKAEYLVSGDTHLLAVRQYQGIQVLSPAVFVALLNEQPGDNDPKPRTSD
jgi:putative PIN family toxin of toxin-antitoxin system